MARDKENTKDNRQNEDKGTMTVAEAGHKGGETVKQEYWSEFYSSIGHHGGEAVVEKYGPEHMAEIGRKGGKH